MPEPSKAFKLIEKVRAADLDFRARDESYKRMTTESAIKREPLNLVQPLISTAPPEPAPEPAPSLDNTSAYELQQRTGKTITPEDLQALDPWNAPLGATEPAAPPQIFDPTTVPEAYQFKAPTPPPVRHFSEREKANADQAQLEQFGASPENIALYTIGKWQGNDFVKSNNIISDYGKLDPYEFKKKYGTETYQKVTALEIAGNPIYAAGATTSGLGETVQDLTVYGTASLASMAGNMTAMGVASNAFGQKGMADAIGVAFGVPNGNDYLAAMVSHGGQLISDAITSNLGSDTALKHNVIAEFQNQANHMDQLAKYSKDLSTDGEMVANLRYGGAQIVDGAVALRNNPKHLETMSTEAAASLVFLGPTVKALSAAGEAMALTKVGAKFAPLFEESGIFEGAAFNSAVGLQEAAGAFGESVQRVMAMDHNQLMRNSPEYRKLREQGYTENDAKVSLAIDAAGTASPLAFAEGFITSKLAPKEFELGVMGQGVKKTLMQDIRSLPAVAGHEFLEETPQSALGQMATNAGIRLSGADPTQSYGENVGETGIQGGIASLGVGPLMKAPGIIRRGAGKALSVPVKLAYNQIAKRADRFRTTNQASSVVSTENIGQDAQVAADSVEALAAGLETLAQEVQTGGTETQQQLNQTQVAVEQANQANVDQTSGGQATAALRQALETRNQTEALEQVQANQSAPPAAPAAIDTEAPTPEAVAQEAQDFIQKIRTSAVLQPTDTEILPANLTTRLTDLQGKSEKPLTRFQAMTEMAKVVEDPNSTEDDRASAAMFVADIMGSNQELFSGDLPQFLQGVKHDNPHFKALADYAQLVTRMRNNPTIADAITYGQDSLVMPDVDLAAVGTDTPKGQQTIKTAIAVATHAPARLNENVANQILQQDTDGNAPLTPEDRQALLAGLEVQRHNQPTQVQAEAAAAAEAAKPKPKTVTLETPDLAPPAKPKTTTRDMVAKQIETEGGSEGHQLSLRQHAVEIARAVRSKNPKKIKERVQNLADFAKSHANKVGAANKSIAKQRANPKDTANVPYRALGSNGKFYDNKKGWGVVLGNKGSEDTAREIHEEATRIAKLANHYIGQHPNLNIEPVPEPPALDLPGSEGTKGTEGSSTTAQATSSPATTSETTGTTRSEPPPGSTPGEASTATDTTAATTETSASNLEKLSNDEIDNRLKSFARQEARGSKLSDEAVATRAKLREEQARRAKAKETEEAKPDDIKKMSREDLDKELEELNNRFVDLTPEEDERYGALTIEQGRRIEEEEKAKSGNQLPDDNSHPLFSRKVAKVINGSLAKLSKALGLPNLKGILNGMIETPLPPGRRGFFRVSTKQVAIAAAVLERFDNGEIPASAVYRIFAHEMGHAIDAAAAPEERTLFTSGRQTFVHGGELWNEFQNVKGKSQVKDYEPDWDYLEKWRALGRNFDIEFFAELFSFVITNTELAREVIPNGTAIVEKILERAGTKQLGEPIVLGHQVPSVGGNTQETVPTEGTTQSEPTEEIKPLEEPGDNFVSMESTDDSNKIDEGFDSPSAFRWDGKVYYLQDNNAEHADLLPYMLENFPGFSQALEENPDAVTGWLKYKPKIKSEAKPKGKPKTVAKSLADLAEALKAKETEPEKETKPKLEPAEEVTTEVEEVPTEPESVSLEDAYSDLAESDQGNFFLKSYKRTKQIGSRLMTGTLTPFALMKKLITDKVAHVNELGNADAMPKNIKAWRDYLRAGEHIIANLKNRFADIATSEVDKNGKPKTSFLDLLDKGTPVNRYMNLKTLNILEKVDGQYRFNRQLLQGATLAAMDWLLNVQDRVVSYDAEKLAGVLGVPEEMITSEILADWNRGMDQSTAKRSLAQHIKKFWDVKDNKDVSETYVQGVAEAMALELLIGMEQTGLLANGKFEAPLLTNNVYGKIYFDKMIDRSDPDHARIVDVRKPDVDGLMKELAAERNTISDIALVGNTRNGRSVGVEITEVSQNQLHNPNLKTTNQQKKAQANVQAARHFTNTPMVNFYKFLGLENYMNSLGGRLTNPSAFDPAKTNINDARSKAGARLELITSFNNMLNHVAEVEAFSERTGIPVSEVPTYFEYAVLSNGRLQIRGTFNGQASKLARNVVTPVRAKIDISKPGSRMFSDFMQAIGQGLGLKTEGLSRREVMTKAHAELKKLRPLIDVVKTHLQDENKPPATKEEADLFIAAQLGDHGFQALMEYARYEVSRETNADLTRFESWNFLEADGKTNGPINALMMWASGQITATWVDLVAKGGMFFGILDKSFDQHGDKIDLYKAIGNTGSRNIGNLVNEIRADNSPRVLAHFEAFRRLMSALNVQVVMYNDRLEISRNFAKNPLTITVYGAGLNNITAKATAELAGFLYAALSESLQTGVPPGDIIYKNLPGESFQKDFDLLMARVPRISKDKLFGHKYYLKKVDHVDARRNPRATNEEFLRTFTLSKTEFEALNDNIQFFLTKPLVEAITEEIMSHVGNELQAIQRATQIQSIVVRNMFRNKVLAKLGDKRRDFETKGGKYPDYNKGDFLSQNELNEIFRSLDQFAPIIDTGTQRYQLNSKERSDIFVEAEIEVDGKKHKVSIPRTYATTLDDQMSTPIFVNTPNLAGIKALPYLNIGSGDGQMMLHGMSIDTHRSDISRRTLPVFDGLNMPIDQILAYSRLINESVFKTWTQNSPMRAVAEGFRAFASTRPMEQLLHPDEFNKTIQDSLLELSKVFHDSPDPESIITVQEAEDMIKGLVGRLDYYADDLESRQQVYRETTQSVDHMASGKGPHNNKGTGSLVLAPNLSSQEIAMLMDGRRIELNAAKLKARGETEAVPIVPASTPRSKLSEGMNKILDLGAQDVTGVTVVPGSALKYAVSLLADIRGDQQFIRQLLKAIGLDQQATDQEYRIVFGTPSQLDAWERSNNADRFQEGSNATAKGKIDPVSKIITVSNMVPETIIHELIHAATIEKLRAYYGGKAKRGLLTETDRDAIERIEGLMKQWLTLDLTNPTEAITNANRMAQAAANSWIVRGRTEGDQTKYMAQAVNEFMAWTLSNKSVGLTASKIKNPVWRIAKDALEAIKTMLFGKSLTVANNILAQLQFNTRVLLSTPTPIELLKSDAQSVTMYQSAAFGMNDRLTYFRSRFQDKINAFLNEGDPNTLEGYRLRYQRSNEIRAARQASRQLVVSFAQHFGDLKTMQAWATFYEMQVALSTEMELNSNSLARMQELYDHTISQLEVKDFKENSDTNDQADNDQAQRRFDAVHGLFVKKTDLHGRSSLLSSFASLAMSSDIFRKVLARIDKPKSEKSTADNKMDRIFEDVGHASVDRLSLLMSGEKARDRNVQEALDNLASAMIENVGDQRSFIEQKGEGFLNGVDLYLFNNMQALTDRAINASNQVLANSNSKIMRAGAKLLRVTSQIINEDASTKAAQGFINALSRYEGLHEIRAIANDIVLRTTENAPIYDMIAETKAVAQQTRQRFRDEVPEKLAEQFSRTLEPEEKTAMFKSMGASDLASLMATHGAAGALRMIADTAHRGAAIRALEASIRSQEGARAPKILEKARQLANYMNTGNHGDNLLNNAYAVTRLFGEPGFSLLVAPHADTENAVDELVTLYAVRDLTQETKDTMLSLLQNEPKGVSFIFNYLVGQRKDELDKAKSTVLGRNNHYKGELPSEQVGNDSLRIVNDREHARMLKQGYSHKGSYVGSSADQTSISKSYYYSPTAGLAPYRQGVMQTVHVTASGVDPQTGYSVGQTMAGRITDGREINKIIRLRRNQAPTNENLRMVYEDDGSVIAIERMADIAQTNTIARNTDLLEMLGAWRGRQVEEVFATEINRSLVDELWKIWDNARREGRSNEFVNMLTTTDPVHMNTAKLIPNLMRDHIKQKFGKDTFMVHRSMALNALGDRQASVSDLFTAETRWKPAVQERFETIALGIFGNNAYNKLVASERLAQNIITNVKHNIIVKSVIVPVGNIMSGIGQLINRGVPLRDILFGMPRKMIEINQYIKARALEVDLEARLRAAKGENNLSDIRKLEDRLQALEDSYKRLSIYPLIKAGEFSAISNGQVTAEDLALADGKWSNYMDKLIAKIPDGPLNTTARYALVTRDTALFQALAKSVQYGDFVMKAILYDDLTKRQSIANKEAIATVNQAFVPYNNLSGRGRHYLESIGLLWFYNYKLRIMKEAVYTLRHHPFRALLMSAIPGLNAIDSVFGSNFLTALVDGRLGYSIGPEQAFDSWSLNPWVQGMRAAF